MSEIEKERVRMAALKQAEAYQFIQFENDKWRFKGRRAGVVDAVLGMRARNESAATLASGLEIPIAAVEEAVAFVDANPATVVEHQRRLMKIANEHSR